MPKVIPFGLCFELGACGCGCYTTYTSKKFVDHSFNHSFSQQVINDNMFLCCCYNSSCCLSCRPDLTSICTAAGFATLNLDLLWDNGENNCKVIRGTDHYFHCMCLLFNWDYAISCGIYILCFVLLFEYT